MIIYVFRVVVSDRVFEAFVNNQVTKVEVG